MVAERIDLKKRLELELAMVERELKNYNSILSRKDLLEEQKTILENCLVILNDPKGKNYLDALDGMSLLELYAVDYKNAVEAKDNQRVSKVFHDAVKYLNGQKFRHTPLYEMFVGEYNKYQDKNKPHQSKIEKAQEEVKTKKKALNVLLAKENSTPNEKAEIAVLQADIAALNDDLKFNQAMAKPSQVPLDRIHHGFDVLSGKVQRVKTTSTTLAGKFNNALAEYYKTYLKYFNALLEGKPSPRNAIEGATASLVKKCKEIIHAPPVAEPPSYNLLSEALGDAVRKRRDSVERVHSDEETESFDSEASDAELSEDDSVFLEKKAPLEHEKWRGITTKDAFGEEEVTGFEEDKPERPKP